MEFPSDAHQCDALVTYVDRHLDVQDDGKKLARRQSNKIAAAKSRQRKAEDMKRAMDENTALKREIEDLKKQIAEYIATTGNAMAHNAPSPSGEPSVEPQPAPPKKRGRK